VILNSHMDIENIPWDRYEEEVIRLRRELHRIPELAFEEYKTSAFIKEYLKSLGYKPTECNKTGVYADTGDNPLIALRADIDALPIQEETGLEYASIHEGRMHACGHDSHTAMLLTAARVLKDFPPPVPVRFIFQPSEERAPGGARGMIEEGVLEGIREIYGIHVDPQLPSGTIMSRKGAFMAASDEVDIWIKGKGGHGSTPEETIDPIYLSALFITAVQSIVSRKASPLYPMVISVCSIHSGSVYNIIPDQVHMMATVRNIDEEHWKNAPLWIEDVLKGITSTHGGEYVLEYRRGYPVLKNNPDAVEFLKGISAGIFEDFVERENPIMGGEDFAYYLQNVPGAFAFIGAGGKGGHLSRLHTSTMVLDESVFIKGVKLHTAIAHRGGMIENSH